MQAAKRYRPLSLRGYPIRSAMLVCFAALVLTTTNGCLGPRRTDPVVERPNVAPADQTDDAKPLALDASKIPAMYTEVMAIDLPAVVQVAAARNFDIQQARQRVVASRGEYESAVGAAFPAIVPMAIFNHVEGTVRATEGNLVGVAFNTFSPSVAIQWVINPGRVIYDIIAARKRLAASRHDEDTVRLETLRLGAVQYYDLVLSQARVSAAHQGVAEAEELLRINRLRLDTGTGVPADTLRAEARLAARRQDLLSALHEFYNDSVALAVTLHLDATVTLVPAARELPPVHLVSSDLSIDRLLELATAFRPDLGSVRELIRAVAADTGARWWGAFGPQTTVSYQYGGIMGNANNIIEGEGIPGNLIVNPASANGSFSPNPIVNGLVKEGLLRGSRLGAGRKDKSFGLSDQQRGSASVGWRLSFSAFGDLKKSKAVQQQAIIEGQSRLDRVRAQVVFAMQASKTNHQLIGLAQQQVTAAAEAMRLTEANLKAGTTTTLDVLQTQDAVTQARERLW